MYKYRMSFFRNFVLASLVFFPVLAASGLDALDDKKEISGQTLVDDLLILAGYQADGSIKYRNGDIYRGGILGGKRHGRGAMSHIDGSIYDGEFLNDLMDGEGVFTVPGKVKYAGSFKGNSMHGLGRLIGTIKADF